MPAVNDNANYDFVLDYDASAVPDFCVGDSVFSPVVDGIGNLREFSGHGVVVAQKLGYVGVIHVRRLYVMVFATVRDADCVFA